ncbi:MAG: peptide chain release factor 1 [Planctomycetes bacterium]|nr:peptide chain release factor 1 [Planctomycetota bacterium]
MTLPVPAIAKLDKLAKRVSDITDELSIPEVAVDPVKTRILAKERGQLDRALGPFREWRELTKKLEEANELMNDPEMADLAKEEIAKVQPRIATIEIDLLDRLLTDELPGDPDSAIIEIRAGTGGDEAALFAMDLFQMYRRYCEMQGWKMEVLDKSDTELGGLREVVLNVNGPDAFRKLRFESGGHRVQRVPDTETQGRIHTSAATVAVLPEVEDIDVEIKDEDLVVDTMRAGGPGGQKVNKTESAVRLTHKPSGIVVKCQDDKSQHRNRATALRILRARLFEHRQQELDKKRSEERKSQIGSGDRSERIRTYNFPQSRMTDHRIGLTLYNLPQLMQGHIGEVINALRAADREERLKRL